MFRRFLTRLNGQQMTGRPGNFPFSAIRVKPGRVSETRTAGGTEPDAAIASESVQVMGGCTGKISKQDEDGEATQVLDPLIHTATRGTPCGCSCFHGVLRTRSAVAQRVTDKQTDSHEEKNAESGLEVSLQPPTSSTPSSVSQNSSIPSGANTAGITLGVPANAVRVKLSTPEVIARLPTAPSPDSASSASDHKDTMDKHQPAPGSASGGGNEMEMNRAPSSPLDSCGTKLVSCKPNSSGGNNMVKLTMSFPSSAVKVRSLSGSARASQQPTGLQDGGDIGMEVDTSPSGTAVDRVSSAPCSVDDSNKGACGIGATGTPNKPQAVQAQYGQVSDHQVTDVGLQVPEQKRKRERKRRAAGHRGGEDLDTVSPTSSEDLASSLFAMDVEGILLNKEVSQSRRRNKKPRLEKTRTESVSESEEELESKAEKSKRRKRKEASRKKRESGEKGERPKRPVPNAFVSVRIPSVEIRDKVKEVQDGMVLVDRKLKPTLVPLEKLHFTLMVLRLEGEEMVERAKNALEASVELSRSQLSLSSHPLVLEVAGVGCFGKSVVFAEVKDGPEKQRLFQIAELVRSVFESHDLPSPDARAFSPHLTIAKLSRSGRKGPKFIRKETFSSFKDFSFGNEVIAGLELLSMTEPAAEDGYYYCFGQCSFSDRTPQ